LIKKSEEELKKVLEERKKLALNEEKIIMAVKNLK